MRSSNAGRVSPSSPLASRSMARGRSSGWTSGWKGFPSHSSHGQPVMASNAGLSEPRVPSLSIVKTASGALWTNESWSGTGFQGAGGSPRSVRLCISTLRSCFSPLYRVDERTGEAGPRGRTWPREGRGSLWAVSADGGRGDLQGLERQVQEVPQTLDEFGPDYAIELDPTAHKVEGSWIRDATLGANDGLVSVLTLIAGVAGAAKGNVVLIAGGSALVAGAISMGVGAFVSARAYRAYFLKELQRELREMRELPDVEREEIREVYRGRGFRGETLEMVVDTITSDPKVWLRVMMQEELGLSQGFGQPLGAALTVFVAFLIGGTVPVIPFVFGSGVAALSVSFVVTAAALVLAGAIRTRFTGERPARAGLELVAMATVGVAVAYGIGRLLHVAGVG